MHRIPGRLLLITAAFALLLVPVAAVGAGPFDDVPDGHTFKADIEWLASVGVTKGCNPPANTKFCPEDPVTRGQMAAFIHRLANGVVDAKTALSAATAADADLLDGKDSTAFSMSGHNHDAAYLGKTAKAADADKLDGHDSSFFTGNDGYSVWHDAAIDIPTSSTTLLDLPDLPAGDYLFIAKTWFRHAGATGEQFAKCLLTAGGEGDYPVATLAGPSHGIPATWTVVATFVNPANSVQLKCRDYGNEITLNHTKITGIRLDSVTNQSG